jgi:hypothetical protein
MNKNLTDEPSNSPKLDELLDLIARLLAVAHRRGATPDGGDAAKAPTKRTPARQSSRRPARLDQ